MGFMTLAKVFVLGVGAERLSGRVVFVVFASLLLEALGGIGSLNRALGLDDMRCGNMMLSFILFGVVMVSTKIEVRILGSVCLER